MAVLDSFILPPHRSSTEQFRSPASSIIMIFPKLTECPQSRRRSLLFFKVTECLLVNTPVWYRFCFHVQYTVSTGTVHRLVRKNWPNEELRNWRDRLLSVVFAFCAIVLRSFCGHRSHMLTTGSFVQGLFSAKYDQKTTDISREACVA